MEKKLIYFLCTGNSCRSQIAEGFAKKYLSDWEIYSAGIETHGLNPLAVKAMQEVSIDISNQTSDLIDPTIFEKATLVVTLCKDAKDKCPVIPKGVTHEHWGFEDPAGKDWSTFQRVRDEIGEKIKSFSETI